MRNERKTGKHGLWEAGEGHHGLQEAHNDLGEGLKMLILGFLYRGMYRGTYICTGTISCTGIPVRCTGTAISGFDVILPKEGI